ncbi:MAG: SAV_2336 N-terminal domain-related protein [Cyanobacteriota bacterium]
MAELLWLARRCPPSRKDSGPHPQPPHDTTSISKEPTTKDKSAFSTEHLAASEAVGRPGSDEAKTPPPFFPPPPQRRTPPTANLLPPEVLPSQNDLPGTLPLQVAQSPLFADRFGVLRVFQPLMRKVPSHHQRWLDESRTAEAFAESGVLDPVFQPVMEPSFRVLVLLDAGVSMEVWRPLAEELVAILASSQAFRGVELVPVAGKAGFPRPEAGAEVSTLVMLLTDGAGPHWWDGRMFHHLERWARHQPLVLLNMLPMAWWDRTAIGIAPRVSVTNTTPAASHRHYSVAPLNCWQRLASSKGLALPVITVEGQAMAIWAAMAMGDSEMAATGILLAPASERQQQLKTFLAPPVQSRADDTATARKLWEEFQTDASPQAQRLLMVMAAAPVLTLPIIRLLMEAKVSNATNPLPMAEVLVSGLLQCRAAAQPSGRHQRLQFELHPGVAALIRERLSPGDTLDVIRSVSAVIERRWNQLGTGQSFEAVLTDPTVALPKGMEGMLHFATVTADLLDRLPGPAYRRFAATLRQGAGLVPPDPFPPSKFSFTPIPFDAAQIQRSPELVTVSFATATEIEIPTEPCFFTYATMKSPYSEPQTHPGTALCLREWLKESEPPPQGIALEMLQIPAGPFQMGSPPDEEGRSNDEGPQHEVTLEAFFLSHTPITQAQWRAVAEWQRREDEDPELWPETLDPDPVAKLAGADGFLGERRPVVNVSWNDAMAFCQRLRLRTGKNYTLPSEAQWEYACRAGTTTPFHFGETISTEVANYDGTFIYGSVEGEDGALNEQSEEEKPRTVTGDQSQTKKVYRQQTTDVGIFPANAWGLHEMHGNVWEWCQDHWHDHYRGAPQDGRPWLEDKADKDERRLLRGGSWDVIPRYCRSAYRFRSHPVDRHYDIGFRVCCLPQDLILYT